MKKILLAIFIVVALPFSVNAQMLMGIAGGGVAAGGDTYTDITYWVGFEGSWSTPTYTLGADDYPGAATMTATSAQTIDATAGIIGTNGTRNTSTTDYLTATVTANDIVNLDDSRIGIWLKIPTGGWAAMESGSFFVEVYGDANNFFRIYIVGTSSSDIEFSVVLRSSGTYDVSATTTTLNLAENTTYFVEIILDQAGNGCTVKVDGAASEVANDAYDAVATAATAAKVGGYTGAATIVYLDNLMISNNVARDLNLLKSLTTSPR